MSLMDDVFDLRLYLKGTEYEKCFENIETTLWVYENEVEELRRQRKTLADFIKYVKEYKENDNERS